MRATDGRRALRRCAPGEPGLGPGERREVHAFDQDETLIGQGTLGLELEDQAPDAATVLAAVGGGGLVGGIAAWYGGRVDVIGVEPSAAPTRTRPLEAGRPVDAPAGGLAADSLAPRRVGERVWPIASRLVRRAPLGAPRTRAR